LVLAVLAVVATADLIHHPLLPLLVLLTRAVAAAQDKYR